MTAGSANRAVHIAIYDVVTENYDEPDNSKINANSKSIVLDPLPAAHALNK